MVPIRALAQAKLVLRAAGRDPLQRLPRRRHQRRAQARLQLGPGARRDGADCRRRRCRPATASNGRARRCRRRRPAGQTGIVLGLAILFAYLFLVALYESWNIPLPVLLSVTVGVLGAIVAVLVAGPRLRCLCPDRPRGAGGAGRQERHPDRRVRRRAAAPRPRDPRCGGRGRAPALPAGDDDQLRLHPGPAAAGDRRRRRRRSAAAPSARRCSAACSRPRVFGIFVIPMLYVVFQRLREWTAQRSSLTGADRQAPAAPPTTSP